MSNPLRSPALSTASASSFDMITSLSHSVSSTRWTHASDSDNESGDDIVLSITGSPLSSDVSDLSSEFSTESSDLASDDDYILLSRPRSPSTTHPALSPSAREVGSGPDHAALATQLTAGLQALSMSEASSSSGKKDNGAVVPAMSKGETARQRRREKRLRAREQAAQQSTSAPATPIKLSFSTATLSQSLTKNNVPGSPKSKKKKKKLGSGTPTAGLGLRPIVDDISEHLSTNGDEDVPVTGPSIHQEAVTFISSFLSNPEAKKDSVCRLTLLQSLIIELGLATSSLPASLTAAKAFLKSHAFLNIREYLAVRGQGPDAVQKLMHPSRSALIRDIRKKKNPANLKLVKEHGLQALLVSCLH